MYMEATTFLYVFPRGELKKKCTNLIPKAFTKDLHI